MVVIALLMAASSCEVAFVDHVTIVNDSDYPVRVEVSGAERDRWLVLTTTPKHSQDRVADFIDQGELWTFRLDYLGRYQQEVEVTEQELQRADWRFEVPESFEEALRARGVPAPP